MGEEVDGEVHGAADVDVDFLVGFLEVEVVDVEGALLTRQSTSGWSSVNFSIKEGIEGMSPVSRV